MERKQVLGIAVPGALVVLVIGVVLLASGGDEEPKVATRKKPVTTTSTTRRTRVTLPRPTTPPVPITAAPTLPPPPPPVAPTSISQTEAAATISAFYASYNAGDYATAALFQSSGVVAACGGPEGTASAFSRLRSIERVQRYLDRVTSGPRTEGLSSGFETQEHVIDERSGQTFPEVHYHLFIREGGAIRFAEIRPAGTSC